MKSLGNIAPIAKELPLKSCGESLDRLAVVDIARRQSKGQQFALIVDNKVQFETIEPTHGGLAPPGKALKDFMGSNTVVITDSEGRRVDEGNPGATAFAGGEIATQGDEGAGEQLDKALIAHQLGEIGAQVHGDVLRIVMLEGPIMTPVKIDQERQRFTQCQRRPACALTLADVQQASGIHGLKGLAEIVNIAEDSNQLVHRGSRRCEVDSWWNQPSIREPLVFSRSRRIPNS